MKTEQHRLHSYKKLLASAIRIAKPMAYFILLLLTYILGYLSAPFSTLPPSPALTTTSIHQSILQLTNFTPEFDQFRVKTGCTDPIPSELVRQTLIDSLFNGTSPFENFPPEHAAKRLRRHRVKGWGSKGAVFENLIRRVRPRIIIEVGTFLGASALHMAELTHELDLGTQIICVDDFRGWAGFRDRFKDIQMINGDVLLFYQFMQNVVTFNQTETIIPMPFSSGSGLMKLCELGVYADLVEVDAGHDFLSAWSDINRGYRVLRTGGVIFGHDYFTAADNRGVRRAVDLFARVHGLMVKVDGQHWVISSSR